jgi:hypothetical protein
MWLEFKDPDHWVLELQQHVLDKNHLSWRGPKVKFEYFHLIYRPVPKFDIRPQICNSSQTSSGIANLHSNTTVAVYGSINNYLETHNGVLNVSTCLESINIRAMDPVHERCLNWTATNKTKWRTVVQSTWYPVQAKRGIQIAWAEKGEWNDKQSVPLITADDPKMAKLSTVSEIVSVSNDVFFSVLFFTCFGFLCCFMASAVRSYEAMNQVKRKLRSHRSYQPGDL